MSVSGLAGIATTPGTVSYIFNPINFQDFVERPAYFLLYCIENDIMNDRLYRK